MSADYAKARSAAVHLLLSSRLYSLKIDATKLAYNKNIIFDSFSSFCSNSLITFEELEGFGNLGDGCAIRRETPGGVIYLVLYNDKVRSEKRRRFTLAHELGHIILGHDRDDYFQETEANCFAAELILPRILVWELQKRSDFKITVREIAETFGASYAASGNQIKALSRSRDFSADEVLLLKKLNGFLPNFEGPVIDI